MAIGTSLGGSIAHSQREVGLQRPAVAVTKADVEHHGLEGMIYLLVLPYLHLGRSLVGLHPYQPLAEYHTIGGKKRNLGDSIAQLCIGNVYLCIRIGGNSVEVEQGSSARHAEAQCVPCHALRGTHDNVEPLVFRASGTYIAALRAQRGQVEAHAATSLSLNFCIATAPCGRQFKKAHSVVENTGLRHLLASFAIDAETITYGLSQAIGEFVGHSGGHPAGDVATFGIEGEH